MKNSLLICFLLVYLVAGAQPFRSVYHDTIIRDSIKILKIKRINQFQATLKEPAKKKLTLIKEFDAAGRLVRRWDFNIYNNTQTQFKIKYNTKGKISEFLRYGNDSIRLSETSTHTYDNSGNEIEVNIKYYKKGKAGKASKNIKRYNEQGQLTETKNIDSLGNIVNHVVFNYDQEGRRIEEITFSDNDKKSSKVKIDREPESFPVVNESVNETLAGNITYDEKGNCLLENDYSVRTFKKNLLIKQFTKNSVDAWYWYSYSYFK